MSYPYILDGHMYYNEGRELSVEKLYTYLREQGRASRTVWTVDERAQSVVPLNGGTTTVDLLMGMNHFISLCGPSKPTIDDFRDYARAAAGMQIKGADLDTEGIPSDAHDDAYRARAWMVKNGWVPIALDQQPWTSTFNVTMAMARAGFKYAPRPIFVTDDNVGHVCRLLDTGIGLLAGRTSKGLVLPENVVNDVIQFAKNCRLTHVHGIVVKREAIYGLLPPTCSVYVCGCRVEPVIEGGGCSHCGKFGTLKHGVCFDCLEVENGALRGLLCSIEQALHGRLHRVEAWKVQWKKDDARTSIPSDSPGLRTSL